MGQQRSEVAPVRPLAGWKERGECAECGPCSAVCSAVCSLGATRLPGKGVSAKPAFSGQPVGQPLAAFFWEKARGRGLSLPGVTSGPSPARSGSPRSDLQTPWLPLTSPRPRESAGPERERWALLPPAARVCTSVCTLDRGQRAAGSSVFDL